MARKLEKLIPIQDHGFSDDRIAIAWAGGLFEGEGCCTHSPRADGKRQPGLLLVTTDRDVALRFQAVVGCGSVLVVGAPLTGNKVAYQWSTRSKKGVLNTLSLLMPYLGERRLERAREVWKIAESLQPPGDKTHCKYGHPLSGTNLYRRRNRRYCITCRKEKPWLAA